VPASCLASCPRRSLWNRQSRSITSRPVPAAAGACSSSRPSSAGGNPARHLTHLHQPGASPRDPARLALISRRNTAVAANAPTHALRHDQRDRTEYEPWPAPDPRSDWRNISLNKSPPTPAPSRFRRHHNKAKLQIPIEHRRSPAGSCMGGFRTPAPCPDARPVMAGIRKPSPSAPLKSPSDYPGKRTFVLARLRALRSFKRFRNNPENRGSFVAGSGRKLTRMRSDHTGSQTSHWCYGPGAAAEGDAQAAAHIAYSRSICALKSAQSTCASSSGTSRIAR
jgi:hypothetical protein